MTIEELIAFCEEKEQNHRVRCKRADDASGYTRSKDKNIRTAVAIREDVYGDFYKQIAETMRKYQKIEDLVNDCADESVDDTSCCARYIGLIEEIIYTEEQEDGNNN